MNGSPLPTAGVTMPADCGTPANTLTFLGYADSLGVLYYFRDGTSARNWDKDADGALLAVWQSYSITAMEKVATYYGNGGTPDVTSYTVSFNPVAMVYPMISNPTWPDGTRVFKGWNTAQDGSGSPVIPGATVLPTTFNAAYAQWEENTGPADDWVKIIGIQIVGGNVVLTLDHDNVKVVGGHDYHVHTHTDLTAHPDTWDKHVENVHTDKVEVTRDAAHKATVKGAAGNTARFFKVQAVKQ
jgi:hypothetical protein